MNKLEVLALCRIKTLVDELDISVPTLKETHSVDTGSLQIAQDKLNEQRQRNVSTEHELSQWIDALLAPVICAFALCLASCAQGPALVQRADGSLIATTGARWLNKTAQRDAVVTLPNGARLEEHVSGEDSTKVLTVVGNSQLMGKLSGGAQAVTRETVNQ